MVTPVAVITPLGPYPGDVEANDLDVAFTAVNAVDGNEFVAEPGDIILFTNTHADTPQTVTIVSTPDPQKRTADVTDYSIAAGGFASFNFRQLPGWTDGSGKVKIEASTDDIEMMVLRSKA